MKKLINLLKKTFSEWSEDKAPRLAASLAYYTVFSLAPLLVIVISVAGLVFGREAAQNQIVQQIGGLIGSDNAEAIQTMIAGAWNPKASIIATIIGVITLLFGATGVFGQLQDALNTMWEVAPKPGRGVLGVFKDRFLSFTMVLGIAFLLLVSLVVTAALASLGDYTIGLFPGFEAIMQVVNFLVSFAVITLLFALIFKVVPDAEVAWKDVWLGAAVTAFLFTLGRFLISIYIDRSDFSSTYGAAGSLIVILLWVYYSAQILFLGAEFTQVYANEYGSRVVPEEDAVPLSEEARAHQGMPRPQDLQAAASQGKSVEEVSRRTEPRIPPARAEEPDLLPQPQPSLLVFSALLTTLVGFISGMVIRRGSK